MTRLAARVVVVVAGSLLLPQLALAQGAPLGAATGPGASGLIRPNTQPQREIAPPAALPGAASQGTAAPATENPADMSPNAALFDAINRGDMAAARDALSRGAELNAHNVLGLTPIELAVDLGRHDIAFLLLSMRGADSSSGPPPAAAAAEALTAKPMPAAAKPKPSQRIAARRAEAPAARPVPPEQPKLFANDGGSPIPSIGFLGFGNRPASP
ncbi:MAG TPA: ankyrin repeat domain-containing protein [Acetobacteraceae bacterium]|nr:ankyrin repeat domain-containing protein [Acetobacteraceae bacterium]